MNNQELKIEPFLRWPGGKRWLAPHISNYFANKKFSRYLEPFIGGGSIFFNLQPNSAIISDINSELIATYNTVKNQPIALVNKLQNLQQDKESYYELRKQVSTNELDIATRLIYLNRLAFSGMYRVNKNGEFNVPYGGDRKLDFLWERDIIKKASIPLKSAQILCQDFEKTINTAGEKDFVYCDPTYTVAHNDNGFKRYNESIFHWRDQERLAECCINASKRGAFVVISNAAHSSIEMLYAPLKPIIVERQSLISRTSAGRRKIQEYLFVLDDRKIS